MKRNILVLFICIMSSFLFSQDKTSDNKKAGAENIYTGLKPSDGTPALFSSQEELNAKVPAKKNNLINLIKESAGDTAQVRMLREQLWRFENAVVKAPK